ncbi:MAG: DUF1848 domain-containing protein [bacterium]
MIINTGNRTDLPAFYSDWFYNRIKAGFVDARSPYASKRVYRYRLDPEVVDVLVFCTKNPQPMLSRLHLLKDFETLWYVTITPYGHDLERHLPNKNQIIRALIELAAYFPHRVIWRYDPIILDGRYDRAYHLDIFEKMCAKLAGSVDICVISFLDLYSKTIRNYPQAQEISPEDQRAIAAAFVEIGARYGIAIYSCLEDEHLQNYGVHVEGCMSQRVIEQALSHQLDVPKTPPARKGCSCLLGHDIGAYDSCLHGCVYCYATTSEARAMRNYQRHDPSSSLLIGHLHEDDEIVEVVQKSFISPQLSIDDF